MAKGRKICKRTVDKNIDSLQKAKNYAFLLLKFRPRSEKEIYWRLKRKKFGEDIINKTLSFLKDKNFINDKYFAQAWIESRINRPLGLRRLKQELQIKGVDKKIIDRRIEEIKKDYSEEGIVLKIAREKLNKLRKIEPEKAKRRTQDFLLRRGFSPEVIIDVINQLCKPIS